MEIIDVRAVGFVKDGVAYIAYEIDHWVSCGDCVMLATESGETVLPLSCPVPA